MSAASQTDSVTTDEPQNFYQGKLAARMATRRAARYGISHLPKYRRDRVWAHIADGTPVDLAMAIEGLAPWPEGTADPASRR